MHAAQCHAGSCAATAAQPAATNSTGSRWQEAQRMTVNLQLQNDTCHEVLCFQIDKVRSHSLQQDASVASKNMQRCKSWLSAAAVRPRPMLQHTPAHRRPACSTSHLRMTHLILLVRHTSSRLLRSLALCLSCCCCIRSWRQRHQGLLPCALVCRLWRGSSSFKDAL